MTLTIKEKLRYVFVPYLLISAGFLAIWLFLYYWLVVEWNIIPIKEPTLTIVFSGIFTFLLVHFVLRPFLKVYYPNTDEILYSIAFLGMWLSCMFTTMTLEKYGDIIEVQRVEEVKQFSNERYFKIADYQLDMSKGASEIRSYISDDDLIVNLYCISPFQNNNEIWFGKHYSQSPKKKKSEAKNQVLIRDFMKEKFEEYEEAITKTPVYFEQIRYSDNYDGFRTAVNKLENVEQPIILEAKYEPFEERFNNDKYLGVYVYGVLSFIFFLFAIFKKAHRFQYLRWLIWQKRKPFIFEKSTNYSNPYWFFRFAIVIGSIAVFFFFIHITFFGLSLMNPTSEDLIAIGSLQYSDLKNGQYWRFLTQIFTFSGVYHFMMSLLLLMFISLFTIDNNSKISKMVIAFFIGAIVGAWVTIIQYPNDLVFGLFFGIMSVLGFLIIGIKDTQNLRDSIFILFFVGISFYNVPTYIIGGIISFIIGIILFFALER